MLLSGGGTCSIKESENSSSFKGFLQNPYKIIYITFGREKGGKLEKLSEWSPFPRLPDVNGYLN